MSQLKKDGSSAGWAGFEGVRGAMRGSGLWAGDGGGFVPRDCVPQPSDTLVRRRCATRRQIRLVGGMAAEIRLEGRSMWVMSRKERDEGMQPE